MIKIRELTEVYCPDCTESLTRWIMKVGQIIPMCQTDLHRFLHNGDYERVSLLVKKLTP